MSFIKIGDGKITNIIKEEDLTDSQKKSVKKVKAEQEEKNTIKNSVKVKWYMSIKTYLYCIPIWS